ncbi:hypothetical protein [Desulfosarcina ovata]|nr:hypothetical protein [Desulfosarcina ovata]
MPPRAADVDKLIGRGMIKRMNGKPENTVIYVDDDLFNLNKIDALKKTVNTIAKRVAKQNISIDNRYEN